MPQQHLAAILLTLVLSVQVRLAVQAGQRSVPAGSSGHLRLHRALTSRSHRRPGAAAREQAYPTQQGGQLDISDTELDSKNWTAGGDLTTWEVARNPQQQVTDIFFKHNKYKKTLYMQPFGGLGNRVRALASAMTIAKHRRVNMRIVWQSHEWTAFNASYDQLFSAPPLPLDSWPGGSTEPKEAACRVHEVYSEDEFLQAFKSGWSPRDSEGRQILCMRALMWIVETGNTMWFYSLLRPSQQVLQVMDEFREGAGWHAFWDQWVGVHVRRSDLAINGTAAAQMISLQQYTRHMLALRQVPLRYDKGIRYFVATDEPAVVEQLRAAVPGETPWGSPLIHTLSRDPTWAADRDSTLNMIYSAADIFLLASCQVLLGTYRSSFSDTAANIGRMYYIMVGAEYEYKPTTTMPANKA